MKISSIKLNHICNHEKTKFEFPDAPIVTLVGDSGSGKTSLIEAIPLAIYGICPSRHANVYQIASRDWKGDCSVEAVFAENGRKIKIVRSWVQTSPSVGSEHKVFIFEDCGKEDCGKEDCGKEDSGKEGSGKGWKQISSGKVSDAKKILDELFPPYEIFLTTNFAAQTGESLLSASQEDRREILGSLLSPLLFAEFDSLCEASKSERQLEQDRNIKIKGELSFTQDRFLKLSKNPEAVATTSIEVTRKEMEKNDAQSHLDHVTQQGNTLKERAAATEFKIKSLQCFEENLKIERNRHTEVQEEISGYIAETFDDHQLELLEVERKKKDELQDQLEKIQKDRNAAKQEWSRIEAKRITTFAELRNLKKAITTLNKTPCEEDLQKLCPFVKNAVHAKKDLPKCLVALDEIDQRLADQGKIVKESEQKVTMVLNSLKAYANLETRARKMLELKQAIEVRKLNYESLIREQKQLQDRITKLENESKSIVIDPDAKNIPNMLITLRKDWSEAQKRLTIIGKELTQLRRNLTLAEAKQEESEDTKVQIQKIGNSVRISDAEMEIWKILEEGFSRRGAQSLLLKREIELFETIIQDYLDVVFEDTGKDVKMTFETERQLKSKEEIRESLRIKVEINGKELLSHELSGGELNGVSIALRAGLLEYGANKNKSALNAIFVDEPTAASDSRISLNVLEVFDKLGKIFPQICILTYDEDLMRTSEVYKVQEMNGIAQIKRSNV